MSKTADTNLKFDVHHHFVPGFYTEALNDNGGDPSGWTIPTWTVDTTKACMDNVGAKVAILSMTAPGPSIYKEPAKAACLAREANLFAASIRDSNPNTFGFFAAIPSLLHKDDAISEIKYALEELQADGVTLFTRYGAENHYLGHPDFDDIWSELNDRNAVVFVHPTHAVDTNLTSPALPQPMIDYPHETTRTAMDLILSGTVRKYPRCKIVLSHAGGSLPYLALRAAAMIPHTPFGKSSGMSTEEIIEDAKSFYFDLALSSNELTLDLLLKFAKPGHILFGSDFPYAPNEAIQYFTSRLDAFPLNECQAKAIFHENAQRLFPRFSL